MLQEKSKPKEKDGVQRIQEIAQNEIARKKREKEEEEKKKRKPGTVATEPSKGILTRLYEYATGTEQKEKK